MLWVGGSLRLRIRSLAGGDPLGNRPVVPASVEEEDLKVITAVAAVAAAVAVAVAAVGVVEVVFGRLLGPMAFGGGLPDPHPGEALHPELQAGPACGRGPGEGRTG